MSVTISTVPVTTARSVPSTESATAASVYVLPDGLVVLVSVQSVRTRVFLQMERSVTERENASVDGNYCNWHSTNQGFFSCRCFDGPDGNRYSGAKCEICPTCPTKCVEYKPCVMCQQWQTGPYDEEKCRECNFKVIPVKELPGLLLSFPSYSFFLVMNETTACQFVDPADDCTFYYQYFYDEATGNATVWVKEHKDCPPPVPVLAIVLGVIAGIVILGAL